MAVNALTVRMKFRNYDEKKLLTVVNNPDSTEVEVKVATDLLKKKGVDLSEQAAEPIKKSVPKKKQEVVEEDETPEEEARLEKAEKAPKKKAADKKKATSEVETGGEAETENDQLTPEEEARLEKAEKEFDARQKNRKTPSRVDRKMAKEHSNKKDEPRQTKRQNIDESEEMPGMKVGVKVTLKEGTDVGEIVRLYRSGDGKEKCMVKFGDEKPIKKRVTALKLYEESAGKAAPKKTTKKK
jgi:hypothetical protein|nr:MAG TPA: hypothetical protein [Caudoviricetes sp.]